MTVPRTLMEMGASVLRKLTGATQVTPGDVYQALYDANNEVHARYEWPWLYSRTKINIQGTYTTGTVSASSGSTTVTGSGTSWNTAWTLKKFMVGNYAYDVASFASTTSLTLSQALNISTAWSGQTYTIFQDTYLLPTDYEPGTDIILLNPTLRIQVPKIPRQTLEQQTVVVQQLFTTVQTGYCDAGFSDTLQGYLIKFVPPPAQTDEYTLVYRRRPPALDGLADITMIPESFVTVLEFMAEAEVRRQHRIPGAVEAEAKAAQLLDAMRRRLARAPVVNQPKDHAGPYPADSAFTWGNLGITPGWRG